MDGQSSGAVSERSGPAEAAILGLLLDFRAGSIWSVQEIVSQLSSTRLEVIDGLAELQGAGLIHRMGDFVFATRAASHFDRLDL